MRMRRVLVGVVAVLVATAGCSVARKADHSQPRFTHPPAVVPTVVAPPQAEGLDGTAGAPGPQVCTAITHTLTVKLRVPVTAKPNATTELDTATATAAASATVTLFTNQLNTGSACHTRA